MAVTYRIDRAASPSRKQIRHVGGSGVGVGAREAGGGGRVAAAIVGIKVLDEWEIGTAGRKGWMDRVEWAGDQLEAVGAIIVKSKCSTLDACEHCCCNSRAGWMDGWRAVGKSWLAAAVMMLPLLLAFCLAAGEVKNRRRIVFGYLHKGRTERCAQECCKVGRERAGVLLLWK